MSVTLALFLSGCARLASVTAAKLMVQAPNMLDPRIALDNLQPVHSPENGFDQRFWVSVGPPSANLLVSTIEPRALDVHPIGTILVLHGSYYRSKDMLVPAKSFASQGYRSVLVDLRGHGQSTGDTITWGVREAADLTQVIDVLERRGLLVGGLGVYGYSFGASTAIYLAGSDPRIQAVVALAPYSSLRDAARHIVRTRVPGGRWFADEQWISNTVQEAGREARFTPETVNMITAIQRTQAKILLVHGDSDDLVPPYHSLLLREAAPSRSHLVLLRSTNHNDLIGKKVSTAISFAKHWFHRWLPESSPSARSSGFPGLRHRQR
jgi:pimeloyl-ACP methyl ester carboxylesterase